MNPDLSQVIRKMVAHGAQRFYFKVLADNDNSKNQLYMGGSQVVQIFPVGAFHPIHGAKRQNFHVDIPFSWLADDGSVHVAPNTKLIYYTDYPEVRLSGFLLRCSHAPNNIMNVRQTGRVMIFGITSEPAAQVIAYVASPGSALANEFDALGQLQTEGIFHVLRPIAGTVAGSALRAVQSLIPSSKGVASRDELCAKLREINGHGWVPSKRMTDKTTGAIVPCNAPNCGGYTLEAELGITANGRSEPDWNGWEVKQYGVRDFITYLARSAVSIMVPNADGGYRQEHGFDSFMSRYGYPDRSGRSDRLNFGGQFRVGNLTATGQVPLSMELHGYDGLRETITDTKGGIALVEADGTVALRWSFVKIMEHWSKKHDHAVYVPSMMIENPRQYAFGNRTRICETTSPNLLLKALYTKKM